MKILSSNQIRLWDTYTIQNEPITSIDLMERASISFVDWFIKQFPQKKSTIHIFCGNGNNGGDGLAIARMLSKKRYQVGVYIHGSSEKRSPDNKKNLQIIQEETNIELEEIITWSNKKIGSNDIIIDALLGSGLNNPLSGKIESIVKHLNQQDCTRIAIDIPTGLFADQPTSGSAFKAHFTFSFQQPKLAFLFPENHGFVGICISAPIGLHPQFYKNANTPNYLITKELIQTLLKKRNKYDHKGTYGHALLIVGSKGKMGAAVLSGSSLLRSGVGLLSLYIPKCGYNIIQTTVPEAMVELADNSNFINTIPKLEKFNSIGVGCGIGVNKFTQKAIKNLLQVASKPLVIDADAINILATNPKLLELIPANSILTPHPKEFERLFGKSENDFERNELQKKWSKKLNSYILLKGANTCIATPKGKCYFNSTGNPGMATAGSGDVLTGIITSLLAQGYSSKKASLLGAYIHGLAGDFAAEKVGQTALIASDIIANLGKAYKSLK